jgi:hypothetical protein
MPLPALSLYVLIRSEVGCGLSEGKLNPAINQYIDYRNLRTQQMSVLVLLCTFYTTCFGPYWWPSSGGL